MACAPMAAAVPRPTIAAPTLTSVSRSAESVATTSNTRVHPTGTAVAGIAHPQVRNAARPATTVLVDGGVCSTQASSTAVTA